MKNINSVTLGLFLIVSLSLFGQSRIYPPALRAPVNGSNDQVPDVVLNWDAVTGGTLDITYELQLAQNEDFSDAVTFPRTEFTSLPMAELYFGTVYYWRVRAYDGDKASEWSETWSFSTLNIVILNKPNNASLVYPDPIISWKPITGLTKYQLQIDTTFLWSAVFSGTTENINSTFILNTNDKWAVGDKGVALHYDGNSWNTVDVGTSKNLNSVYFPNENSGWIVGDSGVILHFDGTSWSSVSVLDNKDLNGVYFTDDNNGWITADSGLIISYNSGSWTIDTTTQGLDIYAVFAVNNNDVFLGGQKGYIYNYDGSQWDTIQLSGKKDVYSLWFTDDSNGWAVGKSGKIFYFDGSGWTKQPSGINKDLYGVAFSGSTGFAVGKSGYMIRYTNGEWEGITSGTSANLYSVSLFANEGIIGGAGGILLRKAGDGFESPYARIINVAKDLQNVQLQNLLFGKTFYYRVRALHSLDTSSWSTVKSIITYNAPELSFPDNGSGNQPLSIDFKWQNFTGVIKYTIQTSENENFQSPLIYFSDLNFKNIDNFGFNKQYYWRVNTEDAADVSDWSEVYSFTTTNTVALSSPANNETNVIVSSRFIWENIAGVNNYQIMLSTDENFTDGASYIINDTLYQNETPLKRNKNYYWKVRGVVALDTSGWSPVWQFTTEGSQSIDDFDGLNAINFYPNPNHGNFRLNLNSSKNTIYTVGVFDMQGKTVYKDEIKCTAGENKQQFNLSLERGIYTITISDGQNTTTRKLYVN